jgi:uncharacterized protein YoxC
MNAKFEAMTPQELAGEFYALENPSPPEKVLFLDVAGINAYLDESNQLVKRVNNALSDADAKIAALNPNLRADIISDKTDAIRKEVNAKIEEWVTEIRQHAELAAGQEKFYSKKACMMRASFNLNDDAKDATIRLSYSNRLAKLNPGSLKMFAEQASADSNLALVSCISEEMESREDLPDLDSRKPNRGTRDEIAALLESVANPSKSILDKLHTIKMNAEQIRAVTSRSFSSINRIALGLQQAV